MKGARSKELVQRPTDAPESQVFGAPERECRDPRFAELDAQIQAGQRKNKDRPQSKRRRRQSDPGMPAVVLKEITHVARDLTRQNRQLFLADPKLKDRAARLLRSLLPPTPRRRGRPARADVTAAIRLLRRYRNQFSDESPARRWARVYSKVIPGYDAMNAVDQRTNREELKERVRWRRRHQKRHSINDQKKCMRIAPNGQLTAGL
jgi:hypothetical protein